MIALAVSYAPALIFIWDFKVFGFFAFLAAPLGIFFIGSMVPVQIVWAFPGVVGFILWVSRRKMPLLVAEVVCFVICSVNFIWEAFTGYYGG